MPNVYYTTDYMADYDACTDKGRIPCGWIWNVMTDLHQQKIALLETLANNL